MKKAIIIFLLSMKIIFWSFLCFAEEAFDKDDMMVWKQSNALFDFWPKDNVDLDVWVDPEDVDLKDNFLKTWSRYLLWVVWIVAVIVSFYIGYELFTAEWKPDQFKKAMKALVYLAVWLAIIPLSYIVIKITTWFSY